jgi:CDP-paratose synthetase
LKKYLITGGNGFFGSHITKRLIDDGHRPILLLRENSKIDRLKDVINKIHIIRINKEGIENIFKNFKIETVIHTACNYGRNSEKFSDIINDNILFGIKIFQLSQDNGVKYFVNIDTTLNKNLNNYSLSKYQFKEWLISNQTSLKIINLRLDHLYGIDDDENKFIYWFLNSCIKEKGIIKLTDGKQKRDFINVIDATDALFKILDSRLIDKNKFSSFDIGSGSLISIKDFILLLTKILMEVHQINVNKRLGWGIINYRKEDFKKPFMNYQWFEDLNWNPKKEMLETLKEIIISFK